MPSPTGARHAREVFGEKEFYLEEFRGRSVLVALSPTGAVEGVPLGRLADVLADLVRNDTRVLLWSPTAAIERRVRGAVRRAGGLARRRHAMPSRPIRTGMLDEPAREALRAGLWSVLRRERFCMLVGQNDDDFPARVVALARALRIPKLVLLDPPGGLLAAAPARLSFVDSNVLATLLHAGQAEWSGLGDRRELLAAVRDALADGVESVNLCTLEGISDELFTYEGSGTLFTRGDYCRVARLGLDDFAQAERLLERGQREGVLKLRPPEEIAEVLSVGFGVTVCDRHLAGVAGLLIRPYASARAGEIVGLYTITRFKGEGIGERLVSRLVAEAEVRALTYVFACTVDERAMEFFARLGFERVAAEDVPATKWIGYDVRRRTRVAVFRRRLAVSAAAGA